MCAPGRSGLGGWRQRALLTQEQLAERARLSVRTITRLESGSLRRPRTGSVLLLADALGLGDDERALLTAATRGQPARPEPPPAARPIPGQLPLDVHGFTGRTHHLAHLDTLVAGDAAPAAVVISAIGGAAGVGKPILRQRCIIVPYP